MAVTRFTLRQVELGGHIFWFDGNGKITRGNGTFDKPEANAFSLLHIDDCPGATAVCKSACYVHGLKENVRQVHDCYRVNSRNIRTLLDDKSKARQVQARVDFSLWIAMNAPGGFRWHVSGDIFSEEYAQFIASVAHWSRVPNWIYTRSFDFVDWLSTPYLTVNLSADSENYDRAMACHKRTGYRICYLTTDGDIPDDLPDGSVIFPDYSLRGRERAAPLHHPWWSALPQEHKTMVCPADYFGQSEKLRCGPCSKCLT